MQSKILTPMETSLLDLVNRLRSDHQQARADFKQQLTEQSLELAALRSKVEQMAEYQKGLSRALTALAPLWGIALIQQP